MTLLTLVLTAVAVVVMVAYVTTYLRRVIADDGSHDRRHRPPRSHPTDVFDPPSRFA